MPFKVDNFSYNGLLGRTLPGQAGYTAEFLEWTNDPGVAKFSCSDGKERLIPTFAIDGDTSAFPEQDMSHKVIFGTPCHS